MSTAEKSERTLATRLPLWVGFGLTLVWGAGFAFYFIRNLSEIVGLASNNLGDFVAGVFAPLAFLWLFVATLLQRQELQLQRAELAATREVMDLQRRELERAANENREQTLIMKGNLESEARRLEYDKIDELLYSAALYMYINREFFVVRDSRSSVYDVLPRKEIHEVSIDSENFDRIYAVTVGHLLGYEQYLLEYPELEFQPTHENEGPERFAELEKRLKMIREMKDKTNNELIENRLAAMDFDRFYELYSHICRGLQVR